MRAPAPYRADEDQQDQIDGQDPTLQPDKANANDNGSSTPPKTLHAARRNRDSADEPAYRPAANVHADADGG